MTDRTHPDSGSIISSSDLLLHEAQTALMYEELRAAIDDGHESMTHADALAEIAAIRAENALLRQHAAKQITDATLLTGISPRNGGMDIGLKGGACQLLAEAFFDQFVDAGAVNFLELRFESSSRMPGQAMTVTMQLADGATPGQKIAEANARIAELEAQLEALRAGGVSGPLMGQPQAMPDLSALTERGAKAWAGVDAQGLREGRWYMVTHDGVATLCEDRRDAEKEAKDADMAWPHSGPHRAVQLVEASMAGYTAADMATASAQGFRDGVASVAANVGSEPAAWQERQQTRIGWTDWYDARLPRAMGKGLGLSEVIDGIEYQWRPLYTHPSPPEGMVGGWMPIETAPKDGTRILLHPAVEVHDSWSKGHWSDQQECWLVGGSASGVTHTYWLPLPPAPPTTSAGSGKGE